MSGHETWNMNNETVKVFFQAKDSSLNKISIQSTQLQLPSSLNTIDLK